MKYEDRVNEYVEDTERYKRIMQKRIEESELRKMEVEKHLGQSSAFQPDKQPDLVQLQLDLKEELDRLYHLLSGHILLPTEYGDVWKEPNDDRLKIFSEYGVKQIMNIISFYLNKNNLLSNYKEEMIMWKVRDFGIELADLFFNRYEMFFHYPTPEDLFEKYKPVVLEMGNSISDIDLYWKCVQWSKEELQSKIRHFPMIVTALIDSVHSTYLRALNGEERRTLRQFIHVSQNAEQGYNNPLQKKEASLIKPWTWGR